MAYRTTKVSEAGGGKKKPSPKGRTMAVGIGESGGGKKKPSPKGGRITTAAVGESGGGKKKPSPKGRTMAVGKFESGGGTKKPGMKIERGPKKPVDRKVINDSPKKGKPMKKGPALSTVKKEGPVKKRTGSPKRRAKKAK